MNIAKLRISMAFLFGCLIFSSCTTHNEYDYQPTIAALRHNTILLSLLDAKGQAYDYELLMQKKNFSVYGLQSKQGLSVRINADNSLGEKRLEFIAELPDEKYMTYNANRSHGEGYATTQLNIEGKTIDLRIKFVYGASEDKKMLADSSIAIERIYCNGVEIKPMKTSYPQFLLTLQKDDKCDFHIVE